MFDTRATDEMLDLWMEGYDPGEDGWTRLGAADAENALRWAWSCRERGLEVACFISRLGKLSFYAKGERGEVFSQDATASETAGARPPVGRGAGAPA